MGQGELFGQFDQVWPSLLPKKVTGSLEVTVTYFVPKGHGDVRGCFDLVYDPKGQFDLFMT